MSETFAWGTEPQRGASGGIPFQLYEPRRRRVPELLLDARRWGPRVHLVQGDRRLTYDHVFAAVDQLAARLTGMGVGPGDRILLLAANSPEWVVSLWAGLRIGAVVAPGNGWWSEEEVEHAIGLVEPTVVIGDDKRLAKVPAGARTVRIDELRALVDGAPDAPAVQLPPITEGDQVGGRGDDRLSDPRTTRP